MMKSIWWKRSASLSRGRGLTSWPLSGEDGLNQARKENPDLILLDVMLPKLNGYKVCRLLKFDERYRHIPILMLTAKTQEKDKTLGKETGGDEYLTKPFDIEELLAKVKSYLREKE